MHQISLPEAFGTRTLHGMLYNMAATQGAGDMTRVLKEIVKVPFLFSIGIRSPKQLKLIADETEYFVEWCEERLGVRPQILFA